MCHLYSTFTLICALPAASLFSVSQLLEIYEDKFLEVVNPKLSLLKLEHEGVISADIRTAIESANDEDAKYILLEHLQKNATVDTLRVYCDVAIAANGFPKMQELGRKIMDALSPGGWLDLWLYNGCMSECWLVHVSLCVYNCMHVFVFVCVHAYVLLFVLLVLMCSYACITCIYLHCEVKILNPILTV